MGARPPPTRWPTCSPTEGGDVGKKGLSWGRGGAGSEGSAARTDLSIDRCRILDENEEEAEEEETEADDEDEDEDEDGETALDAGRPPVPTENLRSLGAGEACSLG